MDILNTLSLKSNRQIKINFDGGDLSSDAGLLLIQEFAAKIGFLKLIKKKFKTNDKSVRFHKDDENLMQMVYQIISAYFEDDCADELTLDPVFNAILEKDRLASQPTLSRFFNRMDEDTLLQFDDIDKSLRDIIYSMKVSGACASRLGQYTVWHLRQPGRGRIQLPLSGTWLSPVTVL